MLRILQFSLLRLALAGAIALSPLLSQLSNSDLYPSAWAKDGGGKGGGGSGGGGGGGDGSGGNGGSNSGNGNGGGGKSSNASQGQGIGSAKSTNNSRASKSIEKLLGRQRTNPTEASLVKVLKARKKVQEATVKFNQALAEPTADLESLLGEIEKAEQGLVEAGLKYQADLAQGANADKIITNSTTEAVQENSQ